MLVADHLGRRGFGTISGAVAVSPLLASAAAPSVGAAMLGVGGPGLIYASGLSMAAAAMAITDQKQNSRAQDLRAQAQAELERVREQEITSQQEPEMAEVMTYGR
jgi:parvulin-like peptidyl-prolyl isomerase